MANSFVFLLIGIREAHQNFVAVWLPAMIAIVLVTARPRGRGVSLLRSVRVVAAAGLERIISTFCFGEDCAARWPWPSRSPFPKTFRSAIW